jgi:hypothetical protein
VTIYEHRTSLTASAGEVSTTSLKIVGGLLRYVLVRANTATTNFRLTLKDDHNTERLNYGFHKGEIVDDKLSMPVDGTYTAVITNANQDDTFELILSVQE